MDHGPEYLWTLGYRLSRFAPNLQDRNDNSVIDYDLFISLTAQRKHHDPLCDMHSVAHATICLQDLCQLPMNWRLNGATSASVTSLR